MKSIQLNARLFFVIFVCFLFIAAKPGDDLSDNEIKTLTVAIVSSHSEFCDVAANLSHFESLIKDAVENGAELVCFPELALMSFTTRKEILDVAEEIPGPSTRKLEKIAQSCNVYLSIGMAERADDKFYITQVVVGPDGYIGKYRKNHTTYGEQQCGFISGKEFSVFNIKEFRFGINICFDGRFESTIQAMKEARVDVIHHPHGNDLGLGQDAEEWTRAKMVYFVPRATYSRSYILINNSAGDMKIPGGVAQFGSGALVIDPLGQVVERTIEHDRKEKMIIVTIKKPLSLLIPAVEMRFLFKDIK